MAEYAILLALLAIAVILALNTLAPQIGNSFTNSATAISTAGAGSGGGGVEAAAVEADRERAATETPGRHLT